MLDFASIARDRTSGAGAKPHNGFTGGVLPPAGFEEVEPSVARREASWNPRLVLVPAWRLDARSRLVKRLLDLALALTALLALALPALAIMAVIRLESPGPVLFRQRRVGLHGRTFTLLKFRTMRRDADAPGTLRQATRHDPRVTRVGRWLRRRSLDEVPQILNVLAGDMSIVGPRPHAPGTRAGGRLFEDVTHRYATRHCVKPGLTGLAQVRGWRGETETEDKLLKRLECDLEYIATWSVGLDLAIIRRTAAALARTRDAY